MKNLLTHTQKLIAALQDANPTASPIIIAGLSGGADSVFLLHLLHTATRDTGITLMAAHLNHNCRDTEDARDENYCRNLTFQLNIPFLYSLIDTIESSKKWNGSREEVWRHKRKTFLKNLLVEHNALGIALGHNAGDQEENFFIRLLRGASLDGLCGMSSIDGTTIRPLLETHRSDIESWLTENKIAWFQDRDNDDETFLRVRIRKNLIPIFETCDDRFHTSFLRTLAALKEEKALIQALVDEKFTEIFDANFVANLSKFVALHPHLQGHLLKKLFILQKIQFPLSASFLEECLRFLTSPRRGTHEVTQATTLVKKQNSFFLEQSGISTK